MVQTAFITMILKVTAEQYSQIYEVDKSTAYEALQDASDAYFIVISNTKERYIKNLILWKW